MSDGYKRCVSVLRTAHGKLCSIYGRLEDAQAQADKYNVDPFFDGEPDPDAPYAAERWGVQGEPETFPEPQQDAP